MVVAKVLPCVCVFFSDWNGQVGEKAMAKVSM
jgi:hypothetical protein